MVGYAAIGRPQSYSHTIKRSLVNHFIGLYESIQSNSQYVRFLTDEAVLVPMVGVISP